MQIVDKYAPMFGSPIAPWHRWFAWRPVDTVDRGYRWFRLVWRRRVEKHAYLPGPIDRWFQHACAIPADADFASKPVYHLGSTPKRTDVTP